MIYLTCKTDKIKSHWQINIDNDEVIFLQDNGEIFNLEVTTSDVFIISLDTFDNIHDIQEFISALPTKLNIIALRDVTNLAEGTLLIKNGTKAYCNSYIDKSTINHIIDTVQSGNTWVYPELMQFIIKHINVNSEKILLEDIDVLSPKEKDIASLVALGNSNKDIAQSLGIALVTVKKHIGHIFEKLNVKDRVALAILINSKST